MRLSFYPLHPSLPVFLLSPHHSSLPSFLSPHPPSVLPLSFPFSHSTLPLLLHPVIPLTPSSFHLSLSILTLHPLSLLSFSLLSCFHPNPLIPPVSSHIAFRSSFHPFFLSVSSVALLTAYQRQFCSIQNVTFKNQQATVSAVEPH